MKFVFRCPPRRFSSSLPKTVDKFVWRVRSPYKRCPCKKSSVLSQDCAILETFFMKRPDKYAYLCINLLKTPKALVVGLRLVNISWKFYGRRFMNEVKIKSVLVVAGSEAQKTGDETPLLLFVRIKPMLFGGRYSYLPWTAVPLPHSYQEERQCQTRSTPS